MIDALALLTPRYPDLELAIVGDGRLSASLARRASRRGVADRVRLLGALPPEGLSQWLRAADLFASPCRDRWGGLEVEGFGIVFAEAALSGLPVMAGRSGGAPEAVKAGETGIVVDGGSAVEVAEGLDRLLRLRPGRRAQMGRSGRELALERHAPEAAAKHYRGFLWEAASGAVTGGEHADSRS